MEISTLLFEKLKMNLGNENSYLDKNFQGFTNHKTTSRVLVVQRCETP